MEYRHIIPALGEVRQNRQVLEEENKKSKTKPSLFSGKKDIEIQKIINKLKKGLELENDIIIAHLENQNELLLELIKKIDRK
jgi:hypothetical protein